MTAAAKETQTDREVVLLDGKEIKGTLIKSRKMFYQSVTKATWKNNYVFSQQGERKSREVSANHVS